MLPALSLQCILHAPYNPESSRRIACFNRRHASEESLHLCTAPVVLCARATRYVCPVKRAPAQMRFLYGAPNSIARVY